MTEVNATLRHVGGVEGGLREVEVEDHEVLDELRSAGQHLGSVDDDRVAIEDELVLAADEVQVGERALGLAGTPCGELEAGVVLSRS